MKYFLASGNFCRLLITSGLKNSTHPLVFTSASGCRASENFEISGENDRMSVLIWIKTVWHSDSAPERIFWKSWFWKYVSRRHQKLKKLPSMQKKQSTRLLSCGICDAGSATEITWYIYHENSYLPALEIIKCIFKMFWAWVQSRHFILCLVLLKVSKGAKIRNRYNQVPLDPGYQWKRDKLTVRHHKREQRGQPFPSRWPQGTYKQTRSIFRHSKHKTEKT